MSIDRVLSKEHFYGKIMQKICTKTSPRRLSNFAKEPKTAIARKKFF